MTTLGRVRAEFVAAWYAFTRRRTAVFFTFFFPVILIVIFGALVRTEPTGGGLFTEPPSYYVPGYVAVVVLFTPLSRVGSEVSRHREGSRFEKLATTPLTRPEWLAAHTLVNVVVIGLASVLILGLVVALTGAAVALSPVLLIFLAAAVTLFCGVGALLGRLADSQDGAIAASNSIALPLLFLSDTFVPPALLPEWFRPVVELSPLTYFSRGVRELLDAGAGDAAGSAVGWPFDLLVLAVLALAFFGVGAYALPRSE